VGEGTREGNGGVVESRGGEEAGRWDPALAGPSGHSRPEGCGREKGLSGGGPGGTRSKPRVSDNEKKARDYAHAAEPIGLSVEWALQMYSAVGPSRHGACSNA
jgi:hypothetical protein